MMLPKVYYPTWRRLERLLLTLVRGCGRCKNGAVNGHLYQFGLTDYDFALI